MEINSITIGIVVSFAIILVFVLVRRNNKDEKDLERFLNENESPIEEKEDDELNDSI